MIDGNLFDFEDRFQDIVASTPVSRGAGDVLGESPEGRAVRGFRLGHGRICVSLLAGCHADEPVGPRFLRHLVTYLAGCDSSDPIVKDVQWWIVPHINPDGEQRNASWQDPIATTYELPSYLQNVVRELPGDDIEFGFPHDDDDAGARPENLAVASWWQTNDQPFRLHCTLHGMGFAAGPWFLIDEAWQHRVEILKRQCVQRVSSLGYTLHDVERNGEKGFVRLGRGFCTRPDSRYMISHFEKLGDLDTARLFRPSSMETIRRISGDVLTLVSEMPLFITPGVGETLGPPDPVAIQWNKRITKWKLALARGDAGPVSDAAAAGLIPMNIPDQMNLQWTLVCAGLQSTVVNDEPVSQTEMEDQ